MTLKEQLELLKTEFTNLKTKITTKLTQKDNTITQKDQEIVKVKEEKQATAHQLELSVKENSENEKVLTQLLKEFKELGETLA